MMENMSAHFFWQTPLWPSFLLMSLALLLDALWGDPVYRFHPIRLMGNLLTFLENRIRALGWESYGGGVLLFVMLSGLVLGVVEGVFALLHGVHWALGWVWYLYLAYSMVALKDLCLHAQRVLHATLQEDSCQARRQAGMMVGRDTASLDLDGCNRAAIESISENLADGVIAPLFYLLLLGLPGMVFYKIVNTLDSMVGYRNEKYQKFGAFCARLDDLLNWIPARLTWLLVSVLAFILPNFSGQKAFWVGISQHHRLPSPNAGWPQAAVAGALQIQLVGPLWREGKLAHDHWLGDPQDPHGATAADIAQALKLARGSTVLFAFSASLLWGLLSFVSF